MRKNGFSLLEIIVAVFFVSAVLVPLISVVYFSLSSNKYSNHRLIAANLAEEGIELVRNIRDSQADWTAWYGDDSWSGDWKVQYNSSNLIAPASNYLLKLDADGYYNHTAGVATIFSRKITLQKISDNEIKVVAAIIWKESAGEQSIVVEDRLYNWQ